MKDTGARERIRDLERKVEQLSRWVVKDCPKCNHQTLQLRCNYTSGMVIGYIPYDYFCLVCGSELECTTETICKVRGK